jgi:8-oxo-dGTP diphosphatase
VVELNREGLVRAAGGVVWRALDGRVEVLVVHRPKYDDWSLPKGKVEPGETDEACAVREVLEETGLECTLDEELLGSEYVDRKGRPKAVRYWAMTPTAGEVRANDEVDAAWWLPVDDAVGQLSYDHDRRTVRSLRR